MRDRNSLTIEQFNIQLEKYISKNLKKFGTQRNSFSATQSFEFRPCERQPEICCCFPKDFRLIRTLCIIQWYLPEDLHYLVYLDLIEKKYSWFNLKQRLEISLYLSSKENTVKYLFLTDRYSGSEIFGNLLENDLKDLSKRFKIFRKYASKPRRLVYRRGPKDYGSKKEVSMGPHFFDDLRNDIFLKLENEKYERKERLLQTTINKILKFLENYRSF
jgi:hypothetical protein